MNDMPRTGGVFNTATPADPLDMEIRPGFRVRDLKSVDECASAIFQMDMDRERIIAQIAKVEAGVLEKTPDWRTKAQSALRWKKRVRQAIVVYSVALQPKKLAESRRQAILDGIRDELGAVEFERLVQIAKDTRPDLFEGGAQ